MPETRQYKSLLEELMNFYPEQDELKVILSKSEHIFTSSVNLFESITTILSKDEANELLKFFMLAIKNNDYNRFKRRLLKANKEHKKDKVDGE